MRILGSLADGLSPARIAATAMVESGARVGPGAQVWHHSQIRGQAVVGAGTIIGRDVYVGPGVVIGERCKVQNGAQVYEPARVADGVFIGPGAVLTNDVHPRAITPAGEIKTAADWSPVGVVLREGASVGARAVCVAPVDIGAWAMIAAGAVVIHDVPAYALVAGVPARRIGWVGPAGVPLVATDEHADDREWVCPATGSRFHETEGGLIAIPGTAVV